MTCTSAGKNLGKKCLPLAWKTGVFRRHFLLPCVFVNLKFDARFSGFFPGLNPDYPFKLKTPFFRRLRSEKILKKCTYYPIKWEWGGPSSCRIWKFGRENDVKSRRAIWKIVKKVAKQRPKITCKTGDDLQNQNDPYTGNFPGPTDPTVVILTLSIWRRQVFTVLQI